jgi:hypothetical protein
VERAAENVRIDGGEAVEKSIPIAEKPPEPSGEAVDLLWNGSGFSWPFHL